MLSQGVALGVRTIQHSARQGELGVCTTERIDELGFINVKSSAL